MKFEIAEKIKLDKELKKKVILYAENNEQKVLKLAKELSRGETKHLRHGNDLMRLAVVLKAAETTYKKYKSKGIPENIFESTFDDVRIWCENNSNRGLKNYGWLKNHVNFELFKLGRLQFQMLIANQGTMLPNMPFKKGDKLLYVHIPQGEKLNFESCVSSVHAAVEFFGKYFPEYDYKFFFCESWLLYENNQKFMKSDSNIIKFAGMFNIHCNLPLQSQTYERVFGVSKPPLLKSSVRDLPETTSLQKAAKAYKLSGGRFGIGAGTVKKEFVNLENGGYSISN